MTDFIRVRMPAAHQIWRRTDGWRVLSDNIDPAAMPSIHRQTDRA
jgi:hypothetical protein